MVSDLYLKFSELRLLEGDDKPFGDLYGATSSAVLTEFLSPQEITDMPEEDLLAFLVEKSRDRISDISKTSGLLRKAARDPYPRYYLGKAANSVRKHIPEYAEYSAKKYAEATRHQHKRALALTSRKSVRLVFESLVKNQLYTGEKLGTRYNTDTNWCSFSDLTMFFFP